MAIAKVIVDQAAGEIDRVFDYRIPAHLAHIGPGWRVTVPFGPQKLDGFVVAVAQTTDIPEKRLRDILSTPDDGPALPQDLLDLAQWMAGHYHCFWIEALRLMLPAQMRRGQVHEKQEKIVRLAVSPEDAGSAMAALRGKRQLNALNTLLSLGGGAEMGVLRRDYDIPTEVWRALAEKGLVQVQTREKLRRPAGTEHIAPDTPRAASAHQRQAIDAVCAAMGQGGTFLLHGVTGSGKTEVYMQCAAAALARGCGVIILVPEIALTPQMTQRFVARFGEAAAVLHSRLSPGERFDEWRRIRRGEARVVVGARSAVFAPLENIGLVVIDEEHEGSYQSENHPRYRAADVARQRCAATGAPLLLGSATPALTSYYAAQTGEYTLLQLPRRIHGRDLPAVQVVDMREELRSGNRSVLSRALQRALQSTLQRGEQAILFLNRRGHSTFVSCRSCGTPVRCEFCDVSMTYHKQAGLLKCHYCGATAPLPETCPQCGSKAIRFFGDGTQKLEEELHTLFPKANLLRMDADTTRGKDSHAAILEAFRRQEAQILLGTQMIAKGLDFPNVTLVGVVAVDSMLFLPDYRAAERAYQLMEQVTGRAGRAEKPGYSLLQTYDPDHPAVRCAAAHDYEAFYRTQLQERRDGQFPPFAYVLRVVLSHEDRDSALERGQHMLQRLKDLLQAREDLLQAVLFYQLVPAPLARLHGRYRYQLVLKCLPGPALRHLEDQLALWARDNVDVYTAVEYDPASML